VNDRLRPFRQGMRSVGDAIATEPWIFAGTVAASFTYAVVVVASARAIGFATDHVVVPASRSGRLDAAAATVAAMFILALTLIRGASFVARRYLVGVFQFRVQAGSRRKLVRRYILLPQRWHADHDRGDLLSTINTDVDTAWMPLARLALACSAAGMVLVAVVDMYLTDVALALIGTLLFPAIILVNWLSLRMTSRVAQQAQRLRGEVSAAAHESFDAALVIKALGREQAEVERFARAVGRLRDANIALGRLGAFFDPAMETLVAVGVLAVLWIGVTTVSAGGLGIGELVQMTYLITAIAFPLRAIGWFVSSFSRSAAGYERLQAIVAEPVPAPDLHDNGVSAEHTDAITLVMRDVSFAYPGTDGSVLTDVGFIAPAGVTLALVGATGSGKSTLALLTAGVWTPTDGSITIDGVAPGDRLDEIAYVPQQAFLFRETVRFNVTLGEAIPDERVWQALSAAQAEDFIHELPLALDQPIGEYGATLSGGQRQRIALARALVRRPRLLILDDCTSAVDPRVEAQVLDQLRSGGLSTTILMISSRLSVIQQADTVIFLADGRVAGCGTHLELWDGSRRYRELVSAYRNHAV
jgi:ABC-type multidrug transport system fused ATPase/permease subunit